MTISGDWYNELGSHMRLTTDPSGGVSGTYHSAAGHAAGRYDLVGRYEKPVREGHCTPLGWTVAWHNKQHDAGSVTSWNGLYHDGGAEQICATWLLTTSSPESDAWEATAVGQDVFTRKVPEREQPE